MTTVLLIVGLGLVILAILFAFVYLIVDVWDRLL